MLPPAGDPAGGTGSDQVLVGGEEAVGDLLDDLVVGDGDRECEYDGDGDGGPAAPCDDAAREEAILAGGWMRQKGSEEEV
jgi:hypothetical protein